MKTGYFLSPPIDTVDTVLLYFKSTVKVAKPLISQTGSRQSRRSIGPPLRHSRSLRGGVCSRDAGQQRPGAHLAVSKLCPNRIRWRLLG
jgi:hypothetical protein